MFFRSLNCGDLFSLVGQDDVYIKIEEGEIEGGYIFNSADISTGRICCFDNNDEIERVFYSDISEI